jgi:hypothetical protein
VFSKSNRRRKISGRFWTALAERSGDSAFGVANPKRLAFSKRRRAPLAAAVQKFSSGA